MNRDVSSLMMNTFSGNARDNFRNGDDSPRNVLLLDRLLTSIRPSQSRLLSLPTEILAEIVEWLVLDSSALASLALVNIECRQLARSAQFASVDFDYSPAAHGLVNVLAVEAVDRA